MYSPAEQWQFSQRKEHQETNKQSWNLQKGKNPVSHERKNTQPNLSKASNINYVKKIMRMHLS